MEYKKLIRDNYTLHLINNDRFKTINILLSFSRKFNKNNIKFYSLLPKNLTYSSKKYNTKSKLIIQKDNLYSSDISIDYEFIGNIERFNVYMSFINPIYLDEDIFNNCIDFMFEVINNPNVKDNKFNKKYFSLSKREVIELIDSEKINPSLYSSNKFNSLMYKGLSKGYKVLPSIEELDSVNEENLYDFYKELFTDKYKLDVFVYGQYDESKLDYLYSKLNKYDCNTNKINIIKNIKRDKIIIKSDSLKFNQSKLYMGFDLSNLSFEEKTIGIRVFNTILGTMNNSVLFSIVREENNLCYSISSYYTYINNALVVYAGINKNNYEKAVSIIKECFDKMKDINFINNLLLPANKTINTFLNNYYDDMYSQIEDKYINEFINRDSVEELRTKLNSVSAQDVINIANKIELKVIYLLKGDN